MRYFFDFSGASGWSDTEGVDLPDLETARLQGAKACAEWLRDHAEQLLGHGELRVSIRDETGRVLDGFGLSWMKGAA